MGVVGWRVLVVCGLVGACAPAHGPGPQAPRAEAPGAGHPVAERAEAEQAEAPRAGQPVAERSADPGRTAEDVADPKPEPAEPLRLEDLGGGMAPPAVQPSDGPRFGSSTNRRLRRLYADRRTTFYCGCDFDEGKRVDARSCGFEPGERWQNRADRVEWEHVMPASRMLEGRACVDDAERRGSPRAWCRRVDPAFRAMEGDLHNLVPAIGQLNAERADHPYGEVPGEPRRFGECDFEVEDGVAEPAPHIRGDIARIYGYMAATYGLRLERDESEVLARWSVEDPPTVAERALWNATNAVLGVARRWKPTGHPQGPLVRRE
jgi:deoxyribonuclease I